jgi:3-hydroxyacyl-CoA dehydrogenase
LEDAAGADLIIEAVFEHLKVKKSLLRQINPHLKEGTVVASNTSALKGGRYFQRAWRSWTIDRAALFLTGRGQPTVRIDHDT